MIMEMSDGKKKGLGRTILHIILMVPAAALIGYLLLVLVYLIPRDKLIMGLANSVSALQQDHSFDEVITGYQSSRLDVFTDGAMLNAALHDSPDSPFRRAVACSQYVYKDKSPAQGFIAYFEPNEPDGETAYTRYWHGFLILLKPLLVFFNYSDIRVINELCQTGLLFLTVYALIRRKLTAYIPAFLLTWIFLMPFSLPLSLQYSAVFYIGVGSLAGLLLLHDSLKDKNLIPEWFVLTGLLTSYFDLLTYPVFTLGLPLTGLLLIQNEDRKRDGSRWKEWPGFIGAAFCWGVGYAGMWACKILLSIPFYGMESLRATLSEVEKRSFVGAAAEDYTYYEALCGNLGMYRNSLYKYLLILYTLFALLFLAVKVFRKQEKLCFQLLLPILLVAVLPFIWYFVLTEHSAIHSFFTYKSLTVAVFACLCIPVLLTGSSHRE